MATLFLDKILILNENLNQKKKDPENLNELLLETL